MPNERLSVSLPAELVSFLNDYRAEYGLDIQSALVRAVQALRDRELERAYAELGAAQRLGAELYPADNLDGL